MTKLKHTIDKLKEELSKEPERNADDKGFRPRCQEGA